MKIKFLKAFYGDSILISFEDNEGIKRNILIDGGIAETYKLNKGPKGNPVYGELKDVIDNVRLNEQCIDLLIITHIDDDHIAGILKWFDEDVNAFELVKEVWFNSGGLIADWLKETENQDLKHFINPEKKLLTSIKQGKEFSEYIFEKKIWSKKIILQGETHRMFGLEFNILSPNKYKLEKLLKEWKKKDIDLKTAVKGNDYSLSLKEHIENDNFEEDTTYPNGSSIAFILTYKGSHLLFLGDSHPSIIIEGLKLFGYSEKKPIKSKLIKISHHGSKGNTNIELLNCIDSDIFVVSTNGQNFEHPHKQFLARLINQKEACKIYFNYEERINLIFSKDDRKSYPNFKPLPITEEFEI